MSLDFKWEEAFVSEVVLITRKLLIEKKCVYLFPKPILVPKCLPCKQKATSDFDAKSVIFKTVTNGTSNL